MLICAAGEVFVLFVCVYIYINFIDEFCMNFKRVIYLFELKVAIYRY